MSTRCEWDELCPSETVAAARAYEKACDGLAAADPPPEVWAAYRAARDAYEATEAGRRQYPALLLVAAADKIEQVAKEGAVGPP